MKTSVQASPWTAPLRLPSADLAGVAARLAVSVLGAAALAWSVSRFGPVPVLAALAIGFAPIVFVMWPRAATLLVVLLLYVNFPAILTKQHGVPAIAAGSFLGLLVFPLARAWVLRGERIRTDTIFGLMIVMLGVMLLSSVAAVDRTIAFDRILAYVVEGLLLYWLILNVVRDLPTLRRVIWAMLAAGALLSALSVYQEVTGSYTNEFGGLAYRNYAPLDETAEEGSIDRRRTWDRAQGPVDDPNRFAQITIVLVPLAFFMFRRARGTGARAAALVSGGLILAGVGLTLSRGAFLGLALLAAAFVAVRWLRPTRVPLVALALLVALSALSPFFIDRLGSVGDAFHLLSRDGVSYQQADGAIRRRMTEMLAALHVFLDHPVAGVGPGQFSRFYVEEYSRDPDIKFREVRGPRRAHTLYFEIGAETGVPGLVIFLAIVGIPLLQLNGFRRAWAGRDPERSDLATAFALSLSAYLVTAIFLHMAFQQYFWLLLACAGAALAILHSHERAPTCLRSH